MREFAHSTEAFDSWKADKERREVLMAGVVRAVLESRLTPVGSAMRTADFNALPEEARERFVSPYFCCLQEVLYGFALCTMSEGPRATLEVTGDQNQQHEGKAVKLYRVMQTLESPFDNLSGELRFADMRETIGLQAADLLAYEMTKELNNQDLRPEDRMRWPLDQILGEADSPRDKLLKFNNAESLRAQAEHLPDEARHEITHRNIDDALRILRDKAGLFKEQLERFRERNS